MLNQERCTEIKILHKQGKSIRQIAEITGHSAILFEDTLAEYDITATDETGILVLKALATKKKSTGRLWIRRGGPPQTPVVLVDYEPSKSAETAYGLLSQCHGYLVSDAPTYFNKTLKRNQMQWVLCNDHARRKFTDVLKAVGKDKAKSKGWIASKAMVYYKLLYRIERKAAKLPTPQQRYALHQDESVRVWNAFIKWATQVYEQGVAHKGTRMALGYLLKHEKGLRRYCKDGRLSISNIKSEHVAKTIALMRKNFLYADTPAGAKSSAMIFSMIESAKENGHNPQQYLSVILTDLPNVTTVDQIEALLPWNLNPATVKQRYETLPKP